MIKTGGGDIALLDICMPGMLGTDLARDILLLRCEGKVHRVALEDILYIETRDKRRKFALASGKKLSVWSLPAQLQESILGNKGMTMCGSSYIVNLNHVRCFSGADLVMDDETRIPVPRRRRAEVRQAYFDFYLKEAIN